MKIKRKARKVADSLVITIPADAVKALAIKEGDMLELDVVDGVLTAKKEEK
jgi:antitoxin component of MazEF toxin-antitoxin module